MTAQEAYILAKAYTKKSIEGAGSLKGAACQIKSIEAITGGHRITFEWEDNDGEVSTDTMDVMDGADGNDGVGISSITYKETDAHGNYVYTVTLTDTNTYDIICPKGAQGETGATGATGNGIASIVKTSTAGLVDTYTITYTNGQTTTFTVTNGESITVDSAMSGSSTNPVQNKVITEALADKQDAEDNNLTTEEKTIVGAINEHEGDISSLKSGLTTLDNEVNGDATYPYADVITIPDAVPANVADCAVKIEPVQDLHGYDHPWVGGAGKNLMPNPLNNGVVGSNGSYSSRDDRITNVTKSFDNILPIKAGTYTISADGLDSCTVLTKDASDNIVDNFANSWNNLPYTFTLTADAFLYVSLRKNNNDNISPNDYQVQVESGSTATSYEPYTNICPITGHTEASVQRDGKNKWNGKFISSSFVESDTSTETYRYGGNTSMSIVANKQYVASINGTAVSIRYAFLDADKNRIGNLVDGTVTTIAPINAVYLQWRTTVSIESDTKLQIESGTSATPYEPYAGKTYTIALGDTIYGGTVDFDSGVMTVDRALVDLGDLDWAYNSDGFFYAADPSDMKQPVTASDKPNWMLTCYDAISYNSFVNVYANGTAAEGNGYTRIANTAYTDATDFKTAMTGQKLVYELATPLTIQLTPQQIQLLKGQNTLTASTGQISVTANGVSGAIGQVQEQVNELAEDVAEIDGKLDVLDTYVLNTPVKIGKWLDRDLYRKVISFGSLPNNNYWAASSGLTNVVITNIRAIAHSASATIILNYPDCKCYYNYGNNTVVIATSADFSSYTSCYVVLEYYEQSNS